MTTPPATKAPTPLKAPLPIPKNGNGHTTPVQPELVAPEPALTATVLTPDNTTARISPMVLDQRDPKTDPALLSAWRRFLDYDRVSTEQKHNYQRIREWVIALYFATAAGAVFIMTMQSSQIFSDFQLGVMRLLLVAMPIISVVLNSYANQFASSIAWIEYRVGAETIRQKIYLYRMRSGEFSNLPNMQDRQRKLLDVINETDVRIDKAGATLPYMQPLEGEKRPGFSVPEKVSRKTDAPFEIKGKPYDDGFAWLPVAEYLDYRIRNQVDWYTHRIDGDYAAMRRFRLAALMIAGMGSLIAALGYGLEGMIAITTAATVALNMKADSRMYGATYATYHLTASRLRNELNQWDILSAVEQADATNASDFVNRMEKILLDERETWRDAAIQLQNTVDRNVNATIRVDGNPIAIETGRTNTLKSHPALESTIASNADPQTATEVPTDVLLTNDTEPDPQTSQG